MRPLPVRPALVAVLAVFLTACTPNARALVVDGARTVLCLAEHQDEPDLAVLARCAEQNIPPEDILRMLAEQRKATAKAAARKVGCGP